jgi:phage protein D
VRKPIVRIIGQSGTDLIPAWSGMGLTRVMFMDNDGGEADELEIEFSCPPPFPDSPAEGTKYRLLYGWDAGGLRDAGLFTYQSDQLGGDPESGDLMTIIARSSDFVDADKEASSEHFDDKTAGEIFRQIAAHSGKSAIVHPDIDGIKLPYRLRWRQSRSAFAQELASELGGTVKYANNTLLVPARNSGQTASGRELPTIVIPYKHGHSFEISNEAKGRYKDSATGWFDPMSGFEKLFEGTSIGAASRYFSLHPARSEEEAELAGKAEIGEEARATISGSFEADGMVDAMAGAPAKLEGFGTSRDAADLVASSIQHEWTFDESGGWIMSVEVASREKKK